MAGAMATPAGLSRRAASRTFPHNQIRLGHFDPHGGIQGCSRFRGASRRAPTPSGRSQRGLDWLNFFIADVETAFGPFISVYLAQHGWGQGAIGSVLTVNSAVALAMQTPAGALVDWTRRKRLVLAACLALIAAGSLLIGFFPVYLPVMAGEFMHGLTGGAVRHRTGGDRARSGRAPRLPHAGRPQSPLYVPRQRGDRRRHGSARISCLAGRAVPCRRRSLRAGLRRAVADRGREIDYARARSSAGPARSRSRRAGTNSPATTAADLRGLPVPVPVRQRLDAAAGQRAPNRRTTSMNPSW